MRFEIFPRKTRLTRRVQWFWRLRALNGEIVAQSEAYTTRAAAVHTCEAIKRGVDPTTLVVARDC